MRGLRGDRSNAHQGEEQERIGLVDVGDLCEQDETYRNSRSISRMLVTRCWLIFGFKKR